MIKRINFVDANLHVIQLISDALLILLLNWSFQLCKKVLQKFIAVHFYSLFSIKMTSYD